MAIFTGTAGDDSILGSGAGDDFHMEQGGADTVSGGAGIDVFYFGAGFDAGDRIDGGADKDFLVLDGDYSAGVTLGAASLVNVEEIDLTAGHSYGLAGLTDANVAGLIAINGAGLGVDDRLVLDASGLQAGSVSVLGGAGKDVLTGGDGDDILNGGDGNNSIRGGLGNDVITVTEGNNSLGGGQGSDSFHIGGGKDSVQGGVGDDRVYASYINPADQLDGGDGYDVLYLHTGFPSQRYALTGKILTGFEAIVVQDHAIITVSDSVVGAGQVLEVTSERDGIYTSLMRFDGHKEKDGAFYMIGGGRGDTFIGGNGDDTLSGGGVGPDVIEGGKGADLLSGGHLYQGNPGATFVYKATHDSLVDAPDEIQGFGDDQTIDLRRIDADTGQAGDQAFRVVAAFDGQAGELVLTYDSFRNMTSLQADVDGDAQADMLIMLTGDHHAFTHFVL